MAVAACLQASLCLVRWTHVADRNTSLGWLMTALRWAWVDAVAVIDATAGGVALYDNVAHDEMFGLGFSVV